MRNGNIRKLSAHTRKHIRPLIRLVVILRHQSTSITHYQVGCYRTAAMYDTPDSSVIISNNSNSGNNLPLLYIHLMISFSLQYRHDMSPIASHFDSILFNLSISYLSFQKILSVATNLSSTKAIPVKVSCLPEQGSREHSHFHRSISHPSILNKPLPPPAIKY